MLQPHCRHADHRCLQEQAGHCHEAWHGIRIRGHSESDVLPAGKLKPPSLKIDPLLLTRGFRTQRCCSAMRSKAATQSRRRSVHHREDTLHCVCISLGRVIGSSFASVCIIVAHFQISRLLLDSAIRFMNLCIVARNYSNNGLPTRAALSHPTQSLTDRQTVYCTFSLQHSSIYLLHPYLHNLTSPPISICYP